VADQQVQRAPMRAARQVDSARCAIHGGGG
jgi:hypothetical protein